MIQSRTKIFFLNLKYFLIIFVIFAIFNALYDNKLMFLICVWMVLFLGTTVFFCIVKKNYIYIALNKIIGPRYKLKQIKNLYKINSAIVDYECDIDIEHKLEFIKEYISFEFVDHCNILDKYLDKNIKRITKYEVEEIFCKLCNYLKIDLKFLDFKITKYKPLEQGIVGEFEPTGTMAGKIKIYYGTYYNIYILLSVIIHEVTHAFCHINDVGDYRNEEFTDLMCIYFGFNHIMSQAYKYLEDYDSRYYGNVAPYKIGYLTTEEIYYAYNMFKTQ